VVKPPDTEAYDQTLRVLLTQISEAALTVRECLDAPEGSRSGPLEQTVRLQVLTEKLTPPMVARTKLRGASWDQIGTALGMGKDTARKKFSQPTRRTSRRAVPTLPPPAPASPAPAAPTATPTPVPASPSGTETGEGGPDECTPPATAATPAPLSATGGRDLATVLSSLQRASGLSLRTLAGRINLSPSFLSRIMSGERFPSWKHVAAIARACGADPEVLRRVWEASKARRDQPCPITLASALRFLHLRAGSPTPWAISVTSGHDLSEDYVAGLLAGTVTGPWEDVYRLVQILDGEPSFFLPLWEAEAFAQPPSTPAPPPPAPKPPTRRKATSPSTRIEGLLTAFKDVLGRPPHIPVPRSRYRPTPIPGITHWTGH
jgi:transcriptional regulator with XRE-family HTH domain